MVVRSLKLGKKPPFFFLPLNLLLSLDVATNDRVRWVGRDGCGRTDGHYYHLLHLVLLGFRDRVSQIYLRNSFTLLTGRHTFFFFLSLLSLAYQDWPGSMY